MSLTREETCRKCGGRIVLIEGSVPDEDDHTKFFDHYKCSNCGYTFKVPAATLGGKK